MADLLEDWVQRVHSCMLCVTSDLLVTVDEDECATLTSACDCSGSLTGGSCLSVCTNRVGTFACGCNEGYYIDVDRQTCIGEKTN